MATPAGPDLLVEPLRPLLGDWEGTGQGLWAAEPPFRYRERLSLAQVPKRALVRWSQVTRTEPQGELSHSEEGFLRVLPEGRLELVLAIPAGYVEIHTGTWEGGKLELGLRALAATPSSKALSAVHRQLWLEAGQLHHVVRIAVDSATPVPHVEAVLQRVS
ncbi:MAG: FABP family protein [Candidatus Dormibacteria bacterium]